MLPAKLGAGPTVCERLPIMLLLRWCRDTFPRQFRMFFPVLLDAYRVSMPICRKRGFLYREMPQNGGFPGRTSRSIRGPFLTVFPLFFSGGDTETTPVC